MTPNGSSTLPLPSRLAGEFEWPLAEDVDCMLVTCPNCGNIISKRPLMSRVWPRDDAAGEKVTLLACSGCKCGFFYPASIPDYSVEPVGGDSALAFYLQQGAGLWSITSILSKLHRPSRTRYLEVGCGFGFGLDFARRMLGWEVLGLDPSPFAAVGRKCLRLPIEPRYFGDTDKALHGRFDVVMASEVLEHVSSPPAFVQMLWAALCEGGTLLLTTPDVSAVRPDVPSGLLVPLLSIGYHIVLQSKGSLTNLLLNAGFVDVEVRQLGGVSLVAQGRRGATKPQVPAIPANSADRALYRRYLSDAAMAAKQDSDLWFGLMARAYREAVTAADIFVADSFWVNLSVSCRRRFGFEAEAADRNPDDAIVDCLEALATSEPLCLGPILLHRAFHRMLCGETRADVRGLFRYAVKACARLRRSLQRIGADDGDIEDITWVAQAEELLCAAERGEEGVADRFATIGPAPTDFSTLRGGGHRRSDKFRRRLFVSLVNAGRLDEAGRFGDVVVEVERRVVELDAILADDELDTLYCAATRELQHPNGDAKRALQLLQYLRDACVAASAAGRNGSAVTLMMPAYSAEILALEVLGRSSDATALRLAASAAQKACQTP